MSMLFPTHHFYHTHRIDNSNPWTPLQSPMFLPLLTFTCVMITHLQNTVQGMLRPFWRIRCGLKVDGRKTIRFTVKKYRTSICAKFVFEKTVAGNPLVMTVFVSNL